MSPAKWWPFSSGLNMITDHTEQPYGEIPCKGVIDWDDDAYGHCSKYLLYLQLVDMLHLLAWLILVMG